MRKRSISCHASLVPKLQRYGDSAPSQRAASKRLAVLSSVLYAVAIGDGTIKIGYTTDVVRRLDKLRSTSGEPCRLLAIHLGTMDDERELHRSLRDHRSHGREYYHPHPEVLALVDQWRLALGQAPLSADGQAAVRR